MNCESIMNPATQQSHQECCPPTVDHPPGYSCCTAHWGRRPRWLRGRRRCCWWSCRWSPRKEIPGPVRTGEAPQLGFDFGGLGGVADDVDDVDVVVDVDVDVGGREIE